MQQGNIVFWWFLRSYLTSCCSSYWNFLSSEQRNFLMLLKLPGDGYSLLCSKKQPPRHKISSHRFLCDVFNVHRIRYDYYFIDIMGLNFFNDKFSIKSTFLKVNIFANFIDVNFFIDKLLINSTDAFWQKINALKVKRWFLYKAMIEGCRNSPKFSYSGLFFANFGGEKTTFVCEKTI